jgi:hypothetical protein
VAFHALLAQGGQLHERAGADGEQQTRLGQGGGGPGEFDDAELGAVEPAQRLGRDACGCEKLGGRVVGAAAQDGALRHPVSGQTFLGRPKFCSDPGPVGVNRAGAVISCAATRAGCSVRTGAVPGSAWNASRTVQVLGSGRARRSAIPPRRSSGAPAASGWTSPAHVRTGHVHSPHLPGGGAAAFPGIAVIDQPHHSEPIVVVGVLPCRDGR